jgi:hypothetical protein
MNTLYETDLVAWANEQAALIRAGKFDQLDVEHLAEEMESMSAKEKRELRNRLAILLQHLLKWQYQPQFRCSSWTTTIYEQRLNIKDIIEDSPSLKNILSERFESAYRLGISRASSETGIPITKFPNICEYTLENTLNDDWLPS